MVTQQVQDDDDDDDLMTGYKNKIWPMAEIKTCKHISNVTQKYTTDASDDSLWWCQCSAASSEMSSRMRRVPPKQTGKKGAGGTNLLHNVSSQGLSPHSNNHLATFRPGCPTALPTAWFHPMSAHRPIQWNRCCMTGHKLQQAGQQNVTSPRYEIK